ncbi:MAG TPA: hypothetical protein DCP10_05400 [Bacteroidales bacterium]|nr:hypothetical protein [Bacteroidales bacterium]
MQGLIPISKEMFCKSVYVIEFFNRTVEAVFRTFLHHPYKYLIININFVILGVAKFLSCLSEK